MAIKTVAQSGLYSDTNTWIGGSLPLANDQVLNPGFAVDQDITAELGNGTGDAIDCGPGSAWTIKANQTLTFHGILLFDKSPFTLEDGATLTNPDNVSYAIKLGITNDAANNIMIATGTLANPVTIQANGGSSSYINFPYGTVSNGTNMDLAFVFFKRVGGVTDGQVGELGIRLGMGVAGTKVKFRNVDFDDCGGVITNGLLHASAEFDWDRVTMRNTPSAVTHSLWVKNTTNIGVGGVRNITNFVYDSQVFLQYFMDFTPSQWVGRERFYVQNGYDRSSELTNFLTYKPDPSDGGRNSTIKCRNGYWVSDHTGTNPHAFQHPAMVGNFTVERIYFEMTENGPTEGNGFLHGSAVASASEITYTRCISLPLPNGLMPMEMVAFGGGSPLNFTAKLIRNTWYQLLLTIGETHTPVAAMITELSGNCVYDNVADRQPKARDLNGTIADALPPANAFDNAGFNNAAGDNGNGYDGFDNPSGTLGDDDIVADPQFTVTPAGIKSWDASLGGNQVLSDILDRMSKLNDSDFDNRYTVQNLMAYVDARHIPGNEAYRGAAAGEDIGAIDMPPIVAGGGGVALVGGSNPLISQ